MLDRPAGRRRSIVTRTWLALPIAMLMASAAFATPLDFLPVGDPLETEIRILDVLGPSAGRTQRLPHLFMRPLQSVELASVEMEPDASRARRISLERAARWLARDRDPADPAASVPGVTPRFFQRSFEDEQRVEFSGAVEGRGNATKQDSRFVTGTGVHGRIGIQSGVWLGYAHIFAGHVDDARTFSDPISPDNDAIVYSEESYLAATGRDARWSLQFGRSRWHFGPGDESSLILSKTSAPLLGFALRVRIEPIRLDAIALSATLKASSGEQLAAHRLEWQATDGLRLGLTEAARYHSSSWQPAYAVGVLPYVLIQRMQAQDEPESLNAVRNNEIIGFDFGWRIAPGTRVYGEFAVDDLHARTNDNPNKLAYQLGLEGAGGWGNTRLSWGTEFTRLSRFVYTSFFGRDFAAQDRPLGFPIGPDARRLRVHGAWDLSTAWQLTGAVAQTDKGENDLDEPYVPGTPKPDPGTFEGVVERTREAEFGVRFWPSSGVDVALLGGYHWTDDAGHVAGAHSRGASGSIALRLIR
jgi:hypothetical protein